MSHRNSLVPRFHLRSTLAFHHLIKSLMQILIVLALAGCSGKNDGSISASGTIEATEVIVGAKIGGQVTALLADEGRQVAKGDTLATIDNADLKIQLAQTEANAAAAKAQYQLAARGAREEDITQAQANFTNAQDDLHRIEALFKERTVTQKQFDDAQMRFVIAQQTYLKLKNGSRPEEIDAARARRDQALAQVHAISKKIADSYVTAPLSGVITQKAIEEGEEVLPNAAMFRISRLDKVHLVIYISEQELARVKLGQEAKVFIDAEPTKPFVGRITYISSVAEFTPKNVQTKEDRTKLVFGVKIEINNPNQVLKPGMPADALIEAPR